MDLLLRWGSFYVCPSNLPLEFPAHQCWLADDPLRPEGDTHCLDEGFKPLKLWDWLFPDLIKPMLWQY